MTLLADTLDLLQRHHRQNRPAMNRGQPPRTAEWHSLWGKLKEIRGAAEAGDVESRDWLALHGPMIAAVEACREQDLRGAATYRGPGR